MTRRRLLIDFRSPTPAYLQLANQLREMITTGEIGPDEALPSLKRMVQETGLAQSTVQKAVKRLIEEGLVVSVPGRGVYVSPP